MCPCKDYLAVVSILFGARLQQQFLVHRSGPPQCPTEYKDGSRSHSPKMVAIKRWKLRLCYYLIPAPYPLTPLPFVSLASKTSPSPSFFPPETLTTPYLSPAPAKLAPKRIRDPDPRIDSAIARVHDGSAITMKDDIS